MKVSVCQVLIRVNRMIHKKTFPFSERFSCVFVTLAGIEPASSESESEILSIEIQSRSQIEGVCPIALQK
jgi:hypothetical protein